MSAIDGEPAGDWVAKFYGAAANLAKLEIVAGSAARVQRALSIGKTHASYHTAAIAKIADSPDKLREAWEDGPLQRKIRVSLAELISHLAVGFSPYTGVSRIVASRGAPC